MKSKFTSLRSLTLILALIPHCLFAKEPNTGSNAYPQAPVSFLENKGEVTDQNKAPRNDIDYKLSAEGISAFIGKGQIHYQWNRPRTQTAGETRPIFDMYRIDVTLIGADKNAVVITEQPVNYYETYYLPQCPAGTIARSFGKLTYKNVYPNIDWVLYASQDNVGGLKYEFIVHPGGNAQNIQLHYDGATSLELKDGGIIATSPLGTVTEPKPYSYNATTKKEISSSFSLQNNTLNINVASSENTIVIDPYIYWATYYGGGVTTTTRSVVANADGTAVITGGTYNQSSIATFGAFQYSFGSSGATSDAYLAKINATGTGLVWATYYGAADQDEAYAMTTDAAGNLYIAGVTSSLTGMSSGSSVYQSANGGSTSGGQNPQDCFIAKFDNGGGRTWGTYYGGTLIDNPNAICVDRSGNVFVGGLTNSSNALTSTTPFQSTPNDGFIAKFNPTGTSRIFGTYYNGTVYALSCDSLGNLYVGGLTTNYNNISTSGCQQSAHGGGVQDGFLAKFNATGARQWGTYYGGTGDESIMSVTADIFGGLLVGGNTTSTLPAGALSTTGAFQTTAGSGFIAYFNWAGARQWGTYYNAVVTSITVDSSAKIWVAGNSVQTTNLATSGAYHGSYGGPFPSSPPPHNPVYGDAILSKFKYTGSRIYSTYFGDTGEEYNIVNSYANGKIFMAGTTTSNYRGIATTGAMQGSIPTPPFPATPGPLIPLGFLSKWDADTAVYISKRFTDTFKCLGDNIRLYYGVINPFRSNNVFTLQLSDASGSFATPVNIGSNSINITGWVDGVIPVSTPPGADYRIRIVGSAPADTTYFDNGIDIRISAFPQPIASAFTPVCANSTLYIYDGGASPGSTNFTWNGPGGYTSGFPANNIPNIQFADSGYYVLTGNNYNCVTKDSVFVHIQPNPANLVLTTNSPVCEGDTLRVTASTVTPGVDWFWFRPAGYMPNSAADTTIFTAALTDAGKYKVQAGLNGCFTPSDSVTVVVNPKVIPTMTVSASPGTVVNAGTIITFSATGVTNAGTTPAYQWLKNGLFISGATNSTYTATMAIDLHTGDSICLSMTSNAVCPRPTSIISCATALIDLSVNPMSSGSNILLFPNPNNGNFTIKGKLRTSKDVSLEIWNAVGQIIYSSTEPVNNKELNAQINIGRELPSGVYLLKLKNDEGDDNLRFTIQR